MIEQLPSLERCKEIVVENSTKWREPEPIGGRIIAEIPMAVSSLRVTIDEDRVQELQTSVVEEEDYVSFSEPKQRKFMWNYEWHAQDVFGMDVSDAEELLINRGVENIASSVQRACEKGSISRPIRTEWYEEERPSLDDYIETGDPKEMAEWNTQKKTERVGTKRWGVFGVFTDR